MNSTSKGMMVKGGTYSALWQIFFVFACHRSPFRGYRWLIYFWKYLWCTLKATVLACRNLRGLQFAFAPGEVMTLTSYGVQHIYGCKGGYKGQGPGFSLGLRI